MNRTLGFGAASLSVLALLVVTARVASTQVSGGLPSYIKLQAATPGSVQTGHSNISGTARAGQFIGGGAGLTAVNADLLDGLNSTAFLQAVPNPLSLTGNQGSQPIVSATNSSTSINSSGIYGESSASSGFTYGVYARTLSTSGRAVFGIANALTGTAYAGYFDNKSVDGAGVYGTSEGLYGVYGHAGPTNLDGIGGYFVSDAHRGAAVQGVANGAFSSAHGGEFTSVGGDGVRAETDGIVGVRGRTNAGGALFSFGGRFTSGSSTNGYGVEGVSEAGEGATRGVSGVAYSTEGRGVYGRALASTGINFGGYFSSNSTSGYGVYAATDGIYGVFGESTSTLGTSYGGRFETPTPNGRGVYAYATANGASDTPYGVRGQASTLTLGYGVYAVGDSGASGVKSFRIDHPADPENKYLLHYSSESPFPQNFYSGNVVTDGSGYAWVTLPEYFQDINANFKYQLAVVDNADANGFAQAKVSKKIVGNRFQIRTSAPNTEVSWRIDADRNDLRIQTRRPVDVQDKVGAERGTYQHPEYYNKPAVRGMDYRPKSVVRGENPVTRP